MHRKLGTVDSAVAQQRRCALCVNIGRAATLSMYLLIYPYRLIIMVVFNMEAHSLQFLNNRKRKLRIWRGEMTKSHHIFSIKNHWTCFLIGIHTWFGRWSVTDIPDIHRRGKPQLHRTRLLYITIISSVQTDAACWCRDTCSGSRCAWGGQCCAWWAN